MFSCTNLGDLIDRARDQGKEALVDLSTDPPRRCSFADLDRLSAGVARYLLGCGLGRGERVAILSANRMEYLASLHGILRAGLVAVPVNFKLPRSSIHYVIRDSGARLVFADAQRCADCPADLPRVEFGHGGERGFERLVQPDRFESVQPEPGESALFLYTSGSTGRPKGVVLSHQSHLWVVRTRLGAADASAHRMLVAAPLYHMNALALSQLACAAHATIVLMPQFDARRYIRAIDRERCTWLTSVPPMMAMMLRERACLEAAQLSSVSVIRMGSAPVSESLLEGLRAVFLQAAITNAYGTTEAGPVVFGPHPGGRPTPPLSVGYPHPQVVLRLVDAEGRLLAQGAGEGVLQMKSPALMSGYHHLPELTAKVIGPDGFYHTGDVFRRDADGFYFFVGRDDDMFVSGGENIFPGEVESMLETHEQIEQACVVAVPDEVKGTKPAAFVVLKPGAALSEEQVKAFALAHAPAYQHPRWVWFMSELPLSGTSKVDRRRLEADARDRLGLAEPGAERVLQ
jgi:acyl-CoA synthetase (AMP-forming)/AMP-acid ligase II